MIDVPLTNDGLVKEWHEKEWEFVFWEMCKLAGLMPVGSVWLFLVGFLFMPERLGGFCLHL